MVWGFLPHSMAICHLKPIEGSVYKVFRVSFNNLFVKFHCGEFQFSKAS